MAILETIFDFLINRPIVMMAALSVPLFAAWLFKRCFPSQLLLLLSVVPLSISVVSVFVPQVVPAILVVSLLIVAVAVADLLTVAQKRDFLVSREVVKVASLGKQHDCTITVANKSRWSLTTEIKDDLPNEFESDTESFSHQFTPRSRTSFSYRFKPDERGRFEMKLIYIKVISRLALWNTFHAIDAVNEIFVYPDMKQISQYSLLARTNRLSLLGVRRSRKIGQDNEFERLRDYTQDDNYKHIDWRTTARRQRLTVKDFQANQSQRIIFMVDCGRMMTGQSNDGIDLFDHALNAMLMLSYVALSQGDSVGLICFSNTIHNYTPPRAGVNHINRILHATFDQRAQFVESRYDNAFYYLRKHCLKRSLVVLITNVIDEINAESVQQYLGNLKTRHLPMGVLLRDHQMFKAIDSYIEHPSPQDSNEFYSAAVAAKIVNWRHEILTDLQHQGVLAVDVFPEQLTARLVNSYLEIKAKHLL